MRVVVGYYQFCEMCTAPHKKGTESNVTNFLRSSVPATPMHRRKKISYQTRLSKIAANNIFGEKKNIGWQNSDTFSFTV